MKKPIHNDSGRKGYTDVFAIRKEQLALLGLKPEDVDLYNPDDMIRLYELTFKVVDHDEHSGIHLHWMSGYYSGIEPEEEIKVKDKVWHIRWALSYRIPEVLNWWKTSKEKDISKYTKWLNKQLVRTFRSKLPDIDDADEDMYAPNFVEKALLWILVYLLIVFDKIMDMGSGPETLDCEILDQLMFSMYTHRIFDVKTWKALKGMRARLDSGGIIKRVLLFSVIYEDLKQPKLKKYLERLVKNPYIDHEALAKSASAILEGKKLKVISPPYCVGIAVDE